MNKTRSIAVLGLVTLGVAAAAAYLQQDSGGIARSGELLFPDLLERVNEVAEVKATSGGETFTLKRDTGRWIVPEKSGYPAAPDKIHQLLVGAAGLARVEPKTAKPELYAKLGVEAPESADATSIGYRVSDTGGTTLADIVIGRRRASRADPELSEFYVRVAQTPQAWLVQGRLPSGKTATDWLDKRIAAIERGRIRQVKVTHPDGAVVVVAQPDPSSGYVLEGVPEGAEVDGQWRVNDIGRLVEELSLDDVRPAAAFDVEANAALRVVITTFDGLRIRMLTAKEGEHTYATLHAEFDAALAAEEFPAAAKDPDVGEKKDREEALAALRTSEDVQREVQTLNARWNDWNYRLPSFKADYIAKRQADLIKFPGKKAEKKKEAGGLP